MKRNLLLLIGVLLILVPATAMAQKPNPPLKTQYNGTSSLVISPKTVSPGGDVTLKFSITGSSGGAAGVNCVVVDPDRWVQVQHAFFKFSGGGGSTEFKLQASGSKGKTIVFCYWYIDGYGVDGPTLLSYDTFTVK